MFDLDSGEFRSDDNGGSDDTSADGPDPDPTAEAVLEELRGTDVKGTAPVELLSNVRAWQRRLEDE